MVLPLASGCAGGAEAGEDPAAAGTTAVASAAPTAQPASEGSADSGPTINGIPTEKDLVSDAHGEYRQTTIAPDDPAFTIDPDVIDMTATERYTQEEIEQAHRVAVEGAVAAIDSPMNGSPGDEAGAAKWWSANQDRYAQHQHEEFRAAAFSRDINETVVYKGTHRDGIQFGLQYGNDVAHIASRSIETKSIHAGELEVGKVIAVTLEVNFSNAVVKDGKKGTEYARGDIAYTMLKDASSGKFLITGYSSTFTTSKI